MYWGQGNGPVAPDPASPRQRGLARRLRDLAARRLYCFEVTARHPSGGNLTCSAPGFVTPQAGMPPAIGGQGTQLGEQVSRFPAARTCMDRTQNTGYRGP